MICRNCGKEGTLDIVVNGVEFWVCEYCRNTWSYKTGREMTDRELKRVQRKQMHRCLDGNTKPTRLIIASLGEKRKTTNVKMYHPERDRNVEGPGDIRARR